MINADSNPLDTGPAVRAVTRLRDSLRRHHTDLHARVLTATHAEMLVTGAMADPQHAAAPGALQSRI